jgi:lysylphosphatidylglycerol synthetase-like protein (DUF2156 family)
MTPSARLLGLFMRWADDPNAYATLQHDMRWFERGEAYLAYRQALGAPVVVNDPIGAPAALPGLISAFSAAHPRATYVNLSPEGAALLAGHVRDLSFVCTGTEHVLELSGVARALPTPVRGALKKALRGELVFEERALDALSSSEHQRLLAINDDFLRRSQAGRELPLIARGMSFEPEPGVRFFTLRERGELLGFFTLDPWRADGALIGYQLNQIRFAPTRIWGVYLSVAARLSAQLEAEGLKALALGGCAFHGIDHAHALPTSPLYEALTRRAARHADSLHAMSTLTQLKLLFPGRPIHRFLASPHHIPLMPVLRLLRAAHILSPERDLAAWWRR